MQHESIDGLVIRAGDSGENDRYLSVLTAQKGRMTMLAKGARSLKSEQRAVCQLYTYGNFEYYRRGEFNLLKRGSVNRSFYAVSADLDRLNLAAYLSEVMCEVTDEGVEAAEQLRLMLNALYALCNGRYPLPVVKGAFELRTAALSGYAPDLSSCCFCGKEMSDGMYLDVMNGALLCSECLGVRGKRQRLTVHDYDDVREAEVLCPLTIGTLAAVRYCIQAPLERLLSFSLQDADDRAAFSKTAELYLLSHLGRDFPTLRFYHAMQSETE